MGKASVSGIWQEVALPGIALFKDLNRIYNIVMKIIFVE